MPALSGMTKQHPISISFEHEGESVTVVFDRNMVTRGWARKMKTAIESNDLDGSASGLSDILISWDITDDEGNALAPSVEILDKLPIAALQKLDDAIGVAAQPSDAEGEASSAPSPGPSTTSSVLPPTPQNGPAPLESPVPSASPS